MRRIFCFSRSWVPYSEMRVDLAPCWPGRESSLHFVSSERRALFRKRSVPSRRESLHLGPLYLATLLSNQDRLLNSATLRRPAAVVRYRRHIRDAADLQPQRIERADRRFAARARTLDA